MMLGIIYNLQINLTPYHITNQPLKNQNKFKSTNVAKSYSINGGLIIPTFAKSNSKMICTIFISTVMNIVINNKGTKPKIQSNLQILD